MISSVIKAGVTYINISVSRCLKKLAWAIHKWLSVISNIMLFKTVKHLKKEVGLTIKSKQTSNQL